MNLRAANPRRLAVLGGVVLALSAALLFWARGFIREVIVLPLSYLIWVGGVFLETTPQIFFWAALLLLAGMAAYRSLVGSRRAAAPLAPDVVDYLPERARSGQVAYWAGRIGALRAGRSPYFTGALHQAVTRLLLDTLAYRYHLTPNQVEDRLRAGSLDVPEPVRDYALGGMRRLDPEPVPLWQQAWTRLSTYLRALLRAQPAAPAEQDDLDPQNAARVRFIIEYLEKELEVSHDHHSR
jgi:hypothetical protein